jgi:crossover junction endodeoxyribonuclease RuvC
MEQSPTQPMFERIVVGVDPGTAITGYGVVGQTEHGDFELLACGVIRTQADQQMPLRLLELFNDFVALIKEFAPDEVAIEKLFFGRNVTTAITVGQARGVILLAYCRVHTR